MNILPEKFGEFNSVDKDGKPVSPESNNVTFVLGSNEKQMETILTAEEAAAYTIENTLGDWSATAVEDAKQVECEKEWSELEANAIYLAENEGEFVALLKGSEVFENLALYDGKTYTLRKANARGGFGLPAGNDPQGVENTAAEAVKVQKIVRDGQVIIVRDGKTYNVLGAEL